MANIKKRLNPLLLFFTLTLAWTWVVGFIPLLFGFDGTGVGDILFKALVGPAPTIFSLIMVFVFYDKKQKINYLKRCFDLRMVGWKTPLLLILLYSAVCGLTVLVSVKLFHGTVPEFGGVKEVIRAPYLIILYSLLVFCADFRPVERGVRMERFFSRSSAHPAWSAVRLADIGFYLGDMAFSLVFLPGKRPVHCMEYASDPRIISNCFNHDNSVDVFDRLCHAKQKCDSGGACTFAVQFSGWRNHHLSV